MGAEATAQLRLKGKRHSGKALLETDELIFRGEGLSLTLPLASLRNVRAEEGELLFDADDGAMSLTLGATAEKWADRIRNPKSLLDKLDLKPEHTVAVLGLRDPAFAGMLAARVASVVQQRIPKNADIVFLSADSPQLLVKLASAAKAVARSGAIWVIHPKGKDSRVKDTDVFMAAKKVGLTATKVVRFSETHTAEKLVIPLASR